MLVNWSGKTGTNVCSMKVDISFFIMFKVFVIDQEKLKLWFKVLNQK